MPIILNGTTGITTPGITNTGPFVFQGVVELTAGTVSAPSLTTTSDTNTGIYFPAANQIAIATDGVQRVLVDATGVMTLSANPTLSGGTANGVAYLNGSKVLTSGSALTFDGTNLGVGVNSRSVAGYSSFGVNGSSGSLIDLYTGGTRVATFGADTTVAFGSVTNIPVLFTVNSSEQMRLTSTGLGIGTSSPATRLQVNGGYISQSDGTVTTYMGSDGTGSLFGTTTNQYLRFITNNAERMRLDSSGNLGIGTSSPTTKLDISVSSTMGTYGPGTVNLTLRNTNTSETNSGSVQFIGYSGNSTSPYQWALISAEKQTSTGDGNYAGKLHFWTTSGGANGEANSGSYKRLTINGNGNVALQGGTQTASGIGITFPGTQSASSDANCLDDYEEGTWTPRLVGTGGGEYTPSGVNAGRYIKIGKMVWATATLQWSAQVTAYTGNLAVSNLPFTSSGNRACGSMGAVSSGLTFTAGYGEWVYLMDPGYSFVYILQNSTTGAGYSHTPTVGTSGLVYALSVVYEAS